MNDTFSTFLAAYTNAPQNIKNLIDSEEIGLFVDTLLTDSTTVLPKQKLLVILSNRILDLIPDSVMFSQLEEVGLSELEKIARIKNFVTLKMTAADDTNISFEITETEATPQSLSPIRTMTGDNKQIGYASLTEPTYTSIQSAIINENK